MHNNTIHWWPLCFSETVPTTKPIALFWGSQELAVYRDKSNAIRAVEDRCPHRRAPLSLGKITPTGDIQCGYHGWTFNGETGDISSFPNLDEGERLPKCAIETFPVYEHQGVVYIARSKESSAPLGLGENNTLPSSLPTSSGHTTYGLSHQECIVAFLDNPDLFINIFGVQILEKSYGDPKISEGLLVTERAARWNVIGESRFYLGPLRHRADFPLSVHIQSVPVTGETRLTLYRQSGQAMGKIELAFTASTRKMTTVHWRSAIDTGAWGILSPLLSLQHLLHRTPIKLKPNIDGTQLAQTLPNAGEDWRTVSTETPTTSAPQAINQEAIC